ncbi:MAG: hypothetical protein P1U56_20420 [Saprospiraceae bacterium]|nr:hypothetical protein [Saprospiraceae bacterium]
MKYLWPEINNALNTLSEDRRKSAKIGASDMKGSDSRAVIIYCDNEAPNVDKLGLTWKNKVWATTSGSEESYLALYQSCVDFLNGNELNNTQKFYAQIAFTNASSNDSYLALYWRETT